MVYRMAAMAPDASGSAAVLAARLALENAAMALVEGNHDRISLTHFVESVHKSLIALHHEQLYTPFVQALGLDATQASIETVLAAYQACANELKAWMSNPDIAAQLTLEEVAWSEFTYGAQTYEEIFHKVDSFKRLGRLVALQYYLDGLLLVSIRISVGRMLLLRATGSTGRMSILEFHAALERAEPLLFARWIEALRLDTPPIDTRAVDALTDQFLQLGMTASAG